MFTKIAFIALTLLSLETCEKQKIAAEKNEALEKTETDLKSANVDSLKKIDDTLVIFSQEKSENSSAKKTEIIYLKEGENKFLKEYNMNVTFKKMIEDSRCPKGVQCIWQGNAKAAVELMGTYTRPVILELSTLNDAARGFFKMQDFNGYSISLIEVSPEITAGKGFKALKGNYKIGIRIEKSDGKNSDQPQSGTTTR
ncbi:hypothetical protein [Kaistella polysaccharea]|uniref:hypothetical protein n=1 Tax=Kaistella polysaccharea TaxID=2878534 RepID=UPI001CF1959F|nr:hypothetical protein [Kaistella polysaccharea]